MKKGITAAFLAFAVLTSLLFTVSCSKSGEESPSENIYVPTEKPTVPEEDTDDTEEDLPEAPEVDTSDLKFPEDNYVFSYEFAMQALTLCTGHEKGTQAERLENAGFTVISQQNFDKPGDDPSHTCAWTIGKKTVSHGTDRRNMYIVAIRGTDGGEWYSNFDFTPSHSDDTSFSENFLFAAEDVFLGLRQILAEEKEPLLLICGHSRGAACANLLGMLANAVWGSKNVSVYTFACPTTVRTGFTVTDTGNIFNVINPCDTVTAVPLTKWGYTRLGNDIILPANSGKAKKTAEEIDSLSDIAPSVSAYYDQRHSLTGPGLSDDGITTFELMMAMTKTVLESENKTDITIPEGFSSDCDFAPLFDLIRKGTEKDENGKTYVLRQHLPETYLRLLAAAGKE